MAECRLSVRMAVADTLERRKLGIQLGQLVYQGKLGGSLRISRSTSLEGPTS